MLPSLSCMFIHAISCFLFWLVSVLYLVYFFFRFYWFCFYWFCFYSVLFVFCTQALALYEENEMPALKEAKPGLKLRQYKQMIFEQVRFCMGLYFLPPLHVFSCILPCLARA